MSLLTNRCTAWSVALLLSLIIGCRQSNTDDVTPTADPTCQVQTSNLVSVEGANTTNTSGTFSYDAKGLLVAQVTSTSGTSGTLSRATTSYTYDNDGYLTAQKYVYSSKGSGDQTNTYTYTYANGRLAKQTYQTVSDYGTSAVTYTYTYDGSGAISQLVGAGDYKYGSVVFSDVTTSTYANGILTAQKGISDGKEYLYTLDNGRVTLVTNPSGTKTRYTYDAAGYQIKQETLSATGAVTATYTTEYGATPPPNSLYKIQKGFPVVPPAYGKNDRIITRSTTAYSSGQLANDYQYQYQLNSKGYPVKAVRTDVKNNATYTTTYTYANCQ